MDLNFNKPPADRDLPDSITVVQKYRTRHEVDGLQVESEELTRTLIKKPIHVVQAVIGEGDTETAYLVLCTDATHEVVPLSAFKKPAPTEAPAAPVTAEAPAPVEESK